MKDKDDENTKDFIMMSLMLPPSILRDLLDGGYLDDEDLTSMLDQYEKEMKKELPDYTGDDKDHPDYGNRFTDWDFDFDGEDYG
jgi:hypothetical protein